MEFLFTCQEPIILSVIIFCLANLKNMLFWDSRPWLNLQRPVQYRKQLVPFGSACSQQELITFCVMQGSILGSLLFYIFNINDLPNASNVVNTLLFGHNINLFYPHQKRCQPNYNCHESCISQDNLMAQS